MARGFVWGVYVDDAGDSWALRVDADAAAEVGRGWAAPAPPGTLLWPKYWRPRRVVGLDPTGRSQSAIVATTTADLWTNGVSSFVVETTDQGTVQATVLYRKPERTNVRP